jgi:hypothetical protein
VPPHSATQAQEEANNAREIAELTGQTVETQQRKSLLDEYLLNAKRDSEDFDSDPMERIIRQVLSAESPAAVLTPTDVKQARDIIGVPLLLADFDLNQSEFDAGAPFYANMAVLAPGGEPMVVNCGHKKVLAQLVKLKEFDQFPYRVRFITRGTSKQGTPMLEMEAWEESEYADNPPF